MGQALDLPHKTQQKCRKRYMSVAVRKFKQISFAKYFLVLAVLLGSTVEAATGLTYHGRIIKPDNQPLTAASVFFDISIRSPGAENCLLFSETQTLDMTGSAGIFVLTIGEGTRAAVGVDGGNSFDKIFANRGTLTLPSCNVGTTYTPNTADGRRLVVQFNDGSGWQALPTQNINYVPLSIEAIQVGGYKKEQLLRVADGTVATEFSNANWTALWDLITGNSSLYSKTDGSNFNPSAAVDFNGQKIIDLADPTLAQDAATKNYVDTSLGGRVLDPAGVSNLAGNGRTLVWDQAQNKWVTGVPNDSTKLPLAGGTMTGAINMGTYSVTNIGHIMLADQGTMYLGKFDAGQEASLLLTPLNNTTDRGRTWFNVDTLKMRYWDGIAAHDVASKDYVDSQITSAISTASANYLRRDGTVALSADWDVDGVGAGTRKITGLAIPTDADGAVTKAYADTRLLGLNLAAPGAGQVSQSIRWNAAGTAWEYFTPFTAADLTAGNIATALGYTPQASLGFTPVNRAGDTMTGLLLLSADPSNAVGAATKQYVDAVASTAAGAYVRIDGTTSLTADWDLNGLTVGGTRLITGLDTPTVADGAANKAYVDAREAAAVTAANNYTDTEVATAVADAETYADSNILGRPLAAPTAGEVGQSIRWNAGNTAWEYYTPSTSIAADSLNFTDFSDTLALDASTSITAPGGQAYVLSVVNEGTGNSFFIGDQAADASPFVVDASGNVGVGTASPSAKLDVAGNTFITGQTTVSGALQTFQGYGAYSPTSGAAAFPGMAKVNAVNTSNTDGNAAGFLMVPRRAGGVETNGYFAAISPAAGFTPDIVIGQQTGATAYAERVRIDSSGNLGIGTASPNQLLTVEGATSLREVASAPAATANYGKIYVKTADSKLYYMDGAGVETELGAGGAASIAADALNFDKFSDTLSLDASTSITAPSGQAYALSVVNEGTGNSFFVGDEAADASPFVVTAAGNVGIGVAAPTNALEVNGNIRATSSGHSIAVGNSSAASGWSAIALGDAANATNSGAVSFGYATTNSGSRSATLGTQSTNRANHSLALGHLLSIGTAPGDGTGNYSVGIGAGNAGGTRAITGTGSVGVYLGTATTTLPTNNVMAIFGGDVGIGDASPDAKLDIEGTLGLSGSTSGTLTFAAPATVTSGTYVWPAAMPASNMVLQSDNTGALSWVAAASGTGDFKADGSVPMTAPFEASTGSAAAPSLTFDGDEDTGFYNYTANGVSLATNGTERIRFGNNGSITAQTASYLLGSSNTQASPVFSFASDSNTGIYQAAADTLAFTTNSTEKMRIESGGNVGIGDTSPDALLDVNGTLGLSGATSGIITFAAPATVTSGTYVWPAAMPASNMVLQSDNTGALSWVAGGGGVAADSLNFTDFSDTLTLDASTDIESSGTNVLSITNGGTGNSFVVNDATGGDTTPFVVDASGSVGIGVATPLAKLQVSDTITATSGSVRGMYSPISVAPSADSSAIVSGFETRVTTTTAFDIDRAQGVNSLVFINGSAGADVNTAIGVSGQATKVNGSAGSLSSGTGGSFRFSNESATTVSDATGVIAAISQNANGGTISDATALSVTVTNGATSTITAAEGVNISLVNSGTVSSFRGLYIDAIPQTNSDYYSIYSSGAAKSYFAGNVGIGTDTPTAKLQVDGSIVSGNSTYSAAFTCGTSTIDFSTGNLKRLSPSNVIAAGTCNTALSNLVAGGSYTLVVTGNASTNMVTYNFTGYTFKYLPSNSATIAGKDSIYTFLFDGTTVYVTWSTGY